MGARISLLFLLMLGAFWASESRELMDSYLSEQEMGNFKPSAFEEKAVYPTDKNSCTLCEVYVGEALHYLAENKTQIEIIDKLHQSCSKLFPFKQQCLTLVDYYAPVFFSKISSIQPIDLCQRANLCGQIVSISQRLSNDSCGFCHHVVEEAILKLKDPVTKLEILKFLLKGCEAVENYAAKCRRLVFEYGPVMLINAVRFLETNDVCVVLHLCDSPNRSSSQVELTEEITSLVADA